LALPDISVGPEDRLGIGPVFRAAFEIVPKASAGRFKPRYPWLGGLGASLILPLAERYYRSKQIYRSTSPFAVKRRRELGALLARGETAYLAGIGIGGFHNSGVALVEVSRDAGARMICNNEEERFSGRKHAKHWPEAALTALTGMGIGPERIFAWLGTFDYPLLASNGFRAALEELPSSWRLLTQDPNPGFDRDKFHEGLQAPSRLGQLFGQSGAVPVIGMPHHGNHAVFSYLVSPFAQDSQPTMIIVADGAGDCAAISIYLGASGAVRLLRKNGLIDSLGVFYSIISSTQGGWTILSSEGRYMGAAAYGDMDRATNRFYSGLRNIFRLDPDGNVYLNRSLANWCRDDMLRKPYTPELAAVLGPPLAPAQMWNPDAVLRAEDIYHRPQTQERLDKASATQMVFEDALTHVVDGCIRSTGSSRLVLTGGTALNAVANMRLIETFCESYYERVLGRAARLHLWVPPVPNDSGVTVGAAYAFAASAGVRKAPPLQHAFYCGRSPSLGEIEAALNGADGVEWIVAGNASKRIGIDAIAGLMAFITARDGIIGILQGAAETGPRALGHRSILANACNPMTRELINERVKRRELIRPLAPMATLEAARDLFWLSEGASDANYNAYNYMVITVRAKPHALRQIPAVIHADGTARLQIVREDTDPVVHAYLQALGRRTGVEVAVNTSFNVGAPIAQTPEQALEALRRAYSMDGVFMFSDEGPVFLAWPKQPESGAAGRIREWLRDWQHETCASGIA
jgi:carbamoyltransferase